MFLSTNKLLLTYISTLLQDVYCAANIVVLSSSESDEEVQFVKEEDEDAVEFMGGKRTVRDLETGKESVIEDKRTTDQIQEERRKRQKNINAMRKIRKAEGLIPNYRQRNTSIPTSASPYTSTSSHRTSQSPESSGSSGVKRSHDGTGAYPQAYRVRVDDYQPFDYKSLTGEEQRKSRYAQRLQSIVGQPLYDSKTAELRSKHGEINLKHLTNSVQSCFDEVSPENEKIKKERKAFTEACSNAGPAASQQSVRVPTQFAPAASVRHAPVFPQVPAAAPVPQPARVAPAPAAAPVSQQAPVQNVADTAGAQSAPADEAKEDTPLAQQWAEVGLSWADVKLIFYRAMHTKKSKKNRSIFYLDDNLNTINENPLIYDTELSRIERLLQVLTTANVHKIKGKMNQDMQFLLTAHRTNNLSARVEFIADLNRWKSANMKRLIDEAIRDRVPIAKEHQPHVAAPQRPQNVTIKFSEAPAPSQELLKLQQQIAEAQQAKEAAEAKAREVEQQREEEKRAKEAAELRAKEEAERQRKEMEELNRQREEFERKAAEEKAQREAAEAAAREAESRRLQEAVPLAVAPVLPKQEDESTAIEQHGGAVGMDALALAAPDENLQQLQEQLAEEKRKNQELTNPQCPGCFNRLQQCNADIMAENPGIVQPHTNHEWRGSMRIRLDCGHDDMCLECVIGQELVAHSECAKCRKRFTRRGIYKVNQLEGGSMHELHLLKDDEMHKHLYDKMSKEKDALEAAQRKKEKQRKRLALTNGSGSA